MFFGNNDTFSRLFDEYKVQNNSIYLMSLLSHFMHHKRKNHEFLEKNPTAPKPLNDIV